MLLVSRQGKVRLTKWYSNEDLATRARLTREISAAVLARGTRMCNVLEWRGVKVIYKRYASLFFITGIDEGDNELITLELIHHYVECLDRYFGNVCELDIIFNFHQVNL
jgi:AP-1 complex subunit sigma 1/2